MNTPKRPGPVAYITLGLIYGSAFALFIFRGITYVLGIALGRTGNFALITALVVLLCAGCILRSHLTARRNRADQAELRAEIAELQERVRDVEDKAWWNDPETDPNAEDTVELGPNVHPIRKHRRKPPEKRSS